MREQWLEGCWGGCEGSWDGVGVGLDGGGGFGEGFRGAFAECHLWAVEASVRLCAWKEGRVLFRVKKKKMESGIMLRTSRKIPTRGGYGWPIATIELILADLLPGDRLACSL